jgi:hypothetical protein
MEFPRTPNPVCARIFVSGQEWLRDRQLEDLASQLLRQPNRSLLEANEAVQGLLFKAQLDQRRKDWLRMHGASLDL